MNVKQPITLSCYSTNKQSTDTTPMRSTGEAHYKTSAMEQCTFLCYCAAP